MHDGYNDRCTVLMQSATGNPTTGRRWMKQESFFFFSCFEIFRFCFIIVQPLDDTLCVNDHVLIISYFNLDQSRTSLIWIHEACTVSLSYIPFALVPTPAFSTFKYHFDVNIIRTFNFCFCGHQLSIRQCRDNSIDNCIQYKLIYTAH